MTTAPVWPSCRAPTRAAGTHPSPSAQPWCFTAIVWRTASVRLNGTTPWHAGQRAASARRVFPVHPPCRTGRTGRWRRPARSCPPLPSMAQEAWPTTPARHAGALRCCARAAPHASTRCTHACMQPAARTRTRTRTRTVFRVRSRACPPRRAASRACTVARRVCACCAFLCACACRRVVPSRAVPTFRPYAPAHGPELNVARPVRQCAGARMCGKPPVFVLLDSTTRTQGPRAECVHACVCVCVRAAKGPHPARPWCLTTTTTGRVLVRRWTAHVPATPCPDTHSTRRRASIVPHGWFATRLDARSSRRRPTDIGVHRPHRGTRARTHTHTHMHTPHADTRLHREPDVHAAAPPYTRAKDSIWRARGDGVGV